MTSDWNAAIEAAIERLSHYCGTRPLGHTEQRQIIASIRALKRPEAPEGWQPIETAPRDGTKVLIYDNGVFAAWWERDFEIIHEEDRDYKKSWKKNGELHYRGAWTDGGVQSFSYEKTQSYSPIHWQPLPTPPKEMK